MTKRFRTGYKIGVIILAIITAMALGALILLAIGADVFKTYIVILTEPLKNKIGVTEVLLRLVPLTITALGITVAYRSGIINIGAEGQMAIGILATTAMALAFPDLPSFILIPAALLAGALGGAVWGFVPGFLKAKLEVSELLSTVMLNYIAAQLYTFFLRGPMLDPAEITMGSGTPQSMRLSRNLDLTRFIKGTRIHTGLFIALALAVFIYLLLWKTSYGYKMRAAGASFRAAPLWRNQCTEIPDHLDGDKRCLRGDRGRYRNSRCSQTRDRGSHQRLWIQRYRRSPLRRSSSGRYRPGRFLLRSPPLWSRYDPENRRSPGEHDPGSAGSHHSHDRRNEDGTRKPVPDAAGGRETLSCIQQEHN